MIVVCFLVLSSIVFYAWGEPKFVFILLFMTIINYTVGIKIGEKIEQKQKNAAKPYVAFGLICNLIVLFVVKYLGFTGSIFNLFGLNLQIPVIGLPLGVSFYTFQAISYLLDIYRGRATAQHKFINMALYITLFPKILMGPMVRYSDIASELSERTVSFDDFKEAIPRFICGLCKKVLIANQLAVVADKAFSMSSGEMSVAFAWMGIMAYSLQILFDFTGYTDMAIAMGRMFGFHLTENFNYPYASTSIGEYWRRWHITMGAFFKDYVYMPITMSPKLKKNPFTKKRIKASTKIFIAMATTWFLTGLWHGAGFNYIGWGLYFFAAIFIEERLKPIDNPKLRAVVGFITTTLIVKVGQVMFRANGFLAALGYYKNMLGIGGTPFYSEHFAFYLKEYWLVWILAILFSFPVCRWLNKKLSVHKKLYSVVKVGVFIGYCVALVICTSYMLHSTSSGFIYLNF